LSVKLHLKVCITDAHCLGSYMCSWLWFFY
jgi:hypothetical protein